MVGESMRVLVVVLIVVYLEAVSCQDTVHGHLREDVVLPCSYSEDQPGNIDVFWRDGNGSIVLDIENGKENFQTQNQKYKGRVSSFPNEYNRRNVSIIMRNLRLEDAGTYKCEIPSLFTYKSVQLNVSGRPALNTRISSPSGGAAGSNVLHLIVLYALGLLLCF